MAEPQPKKQRTENGTSPQYTLLYHAQIPGRGEPIRLLLEATGTPYTDTAKSDKTAGQVYRLLGPDASDRVLEGNVQPFAPPILQVHGAGDDGKDLMLSQLPNILLYLGDKLGLSGDTEAQRYQINQLTLTACDLLKEAHDTHHPVAVEEYYEKQKDESLRRSESFRRDRVPKMLGYFDRVLKANEAHGRGEFLVGDKLSSADLMLWQTLDGVMFAFPKECKARQEAGEFPTLTGKFYPAIKQHERLKEYLASERRAKYSEGIFRDYPELDRQ